MAWEVSLHPEVEAWYLARCASDPGTADLIEDAIDQVASDRPSLGRPLADRVEGQPLPQHEGTPAAVIGNDGDQAAVRV